MNRRTYVRGLMAALVTIWVGAEARAEMIDYTVDPEHSNVEFEIDHLFSRIRGRFSKFEGKFAFDASAQAGQGAVLEIEVASIHTLVEKRDAHLRSEDFFHVEQFGTIRFQSTAIRHVSGGTYAMDGILEIHGVQKPITLDVEYLGEATDPWGSTRASFVLRGKLDRQDFGVSWNQTVENNVLLVGNEVDLVVHVEAIRSAKAG